MAPVWLQSSGHPRPRGRCSPPFAPRTGLEARPYPSMGDSEAAVWGPGGSWARTVWRELPGLRTEPVSTAPSCPLPALQPSEGEPEGFIFGNHPLLFRPFYPRHAPSSEGQLGPLITGDRNSSNTHFGTEKRAGGEGINP